MLRASRPAVAPRAVDSQFHAVAAGEQLPPRASATFNVFHDSADTRIDLCAATEKDIETHSLGVVAKTIP